MTVPQVTPTTIPVAGSTERFPIRRVYCVGRNYRDHALEMGANPDREPPFFFDKPADAVFGITEGVGTLAPGAVPYPPRTEKLSYESELVVAIGERAREVTAEDALARVWGYTVGIDLTRRDLQDAAKELRRPWDLAKGFDFSGPVAPLVPAATSGHPDAGAIWLDVNGERRQSGDLGAQIWSVPEIIAELSTLVTLEPGDLIFTGTPAGVGPIVVGDQIRAGIDGLAELQFVVV